MLRNVWIVLVLAALSATAVPAVASAHLAKAHRRGAGSASAHPHAHSAAHHTPRHAPRASADAKTARSEAPLHSEPVARRSRRFRRPAVVRGEVRTAEGARPEVRAISLRRIRYAPMPTPLRGSFESLARQNEINEQEGLERILDEQDLSDRIAQKLLVPVPVSSDLAINSDLPETHRYCRPWTAQFLTDLAHAHAERFRRPLEVSSAVRTVEYQKRLMRTNGNAAAAEGDIVSPHVTGATIDIAKNGMSRQELGWMRTYLLPLQLSGAIDVEEEFHQACFHITVYKAYVAPDTPSPSSPGKRSAQLVSGESQPASEDGASN